MTISQVLQIAEDLSHRPPDERAQRFLVVPEALSLPTFKQLNSGHQQELIERLDDAAARRLVEALDPDDRVKLFEQMLPDAAERLRRGLSSREQTLTDELLQYPEESAGRIMSPEFLALAKTMTASEALEAVRSRGHEVETVLALPITDVHGRLAGMATLDALVLASPETEIGELMDAAPPSVTADEDQEAVARLIQEADLLAVPVVDGDGRLLGLVTVDDAMDVVQFEGTEDLARTGAAEPLRRPYFSVSIFRLLRSRVVWLLLLAVAAVLTVNVLSAFEGMLEQAVSLSLFIPLLIGVGGNTGAQSATTIVRAMATDEVRFEDAPRILAREAGVGLLLGVTLGLVGFLPIWLVFGRPLAIVISSSLLAICTLAALVGSLMPVLANRIGIDPAVVSAPFVTTIVDASGLLVYFLIAQMVLNL